MKKITQFIIYISLFTTIVISLKGLNYQISLGVFVVIFWAISPYAFLLTIETITTNSRTKIAVLFFSILVCGFGVWTLADSILIHPFDGGGVVTISTPFIQWVFLLLLVLLIYFLSRSKTYNKSLQPTQKPRG